MCIDSNVFSPFKFHFQIILMSCNVNQSSHTNLNDSMQLPAQIMEIIDHVTNEMIEIAIENRTK